MRALPRTNLAETAVEAIRSEILAKRWSGGEKLPNEAALSSAVEDGDYGPFEQLLAVLANPYDARPDFAAYAEPPGPDQGAYRTFCGT